MNRILRAGLVMAWVWLGLIPGAFAKSKTKPLRIYSIDVEGGQATLIVSPSGQSMLVDTGWPGFDGHCGRGPVGAGQADRLPSDHALSSRPRRRSAATGGAHEDRHVCGSWSKSGGF